MIGKQTNKYLAVSCLAFSILGCIASVISAFFYNFPEYVSTGPNDEFGDLIAFGIAGVAFFIASFFLP